MNHRMWLLAAALAAMGLASGAQAANVALELSLVIDVSGSVDGRDYGDQRKGYADAFRDNAIRDNILTFASSGGIAVNVIQFATGARVTLDWRVLDSADDIRALADAIDAMPRADIGSNTNVRDGMAMAIAAITGNDLAGARKVIDVSGDGFHNTDANGACAPATNPRPPGCAPVREQRDLARAAGITVNGLAIEGLFSVPTAITEWYDGNVRTSDGFVSTATSGSFAAAVKAKIGREIVNPETPMPEPGSLALLALGLAGAALSSRRAARIPS